MWRLADSQGPLDRGADAFVYAERGVYRSNETVYLRNSDIDQLLPWACRKQDLRAVA